MPPPYRDQRRKAQMVLKALFEKPELVRIVHYSCESFYDRPAGRSPRVTSIAVRRLDSGQTKSFSIHQIAEREGAIDQIAARYDEFETTMLREFYAYVQTSGEVNYLHWNMRDSNFGFAAIQQRYEALGEVPEEIPENRRYDLSRLLLDLYGSDYIDHPRLEKLAKKNSITMLQFLSGSDEASRFEQRDYVALHQSTLRKVDVFADIAERAHRATLKTNSSWWVQNGGSIRGIWDWLVENKSIAFILALLGMVVGFLGSRFVH